MLGMFAQSLVNATDIIFMGHVNKVAQGAVGIGSIYYYVLFMIGFGFASGMQILISRRNGEKNYKAIGPIMENGCLFLILLAAFFTVVSLAFTNGILDSIVKYEDVRIAIERYLNVRIYGLVFAYLGTAFRAHHVGITNTMPLTFSAFIMAIGNIILNYLFVFGKFGFPEMGIEGSALASVIAEIISLAYLVVYNARPKFRRLYRLFHFAPIDLGILKRTLDVSIFVMLQYFLSLSTWFAFFIVIEKTGPDNLASSNIIRSLYGFISIPLWAYAASTSSFVSNAIGAGNSDSVLAISRKAVKLGVASALLIIPVGLLLTKPLMYIFTNEEYIVNLSLNSWYMILVVNIVLALSVIPFNALSGTGRTKVAMFMEIICLVFYIIALFVLANRFADRIEMIWLTEFVYWGILLALTALYFRTGRWKGVNI